MVKVEFNPIVSFKSNGADKKAKGRVDLPKIEDSSDSYAHSKTETKAKDKVAKFWKSYSVVTTMSKAILEGLAYGALTSAAVVGLFWPFKALPKAFAKEGPTIGKLLLNPFKHIGRIGQVLSVVSGIGVLGYHFVKGKLDANQNTAIIDHKLKIGHRDN